MSLSRQLRRAAERAQRKEERKALKNPTVSIFEHAVQEDALRNSVTDSSVVPEAEVFSEIEADAAVCHRFLSSDSPAANDTEEPKRSGGPRTPEGKAISSLNNLRHGLAGKFRVLKFESQADFDAAHDALIAEHQPTTPTESELVRRMVEHAWLSRRAQDLVDKAVMECEASLLALFLRYQTTNDRGFRACLNDLLKLRREQRAVARSAQGVCGPLCADPKRFESQNGEVERHDARVRLANARAGNLELDTELRSYVDAPLPGYTSVPVEHVTELFKAAMTLLKREENAKTAA